MATISLTYTVSTADQNRVVAAYQSDANTDINGTASPAQVLAYLTKAVKNEVIAKVQSFEKGVAVAAIVPAAAPVMS